MGFRGASGSSGGSQADLLAAGLGVQFQSFNPGLPTSSSAPTSGTVFGTALYLTGGFNMTGIKMRNATAAAGTLPTTVRFGIADATGKMLAVSANVNALANWTAGVVAFPVALTVPSSAVYFACFIVNGSWNVTQPAPINVNVNSTATGADGSNPPPVFSWTGQTDLPAVGASLTLNATSRMYWLGVY